VFDVNQNRVAGFGVAAGVAAAVVAVWLATGALQSFSAITSSRAERNVCFIAVPNGWTLKQFYDDRLERNTAEIMYSYTARPERRTAAYMYSHPWDPNLDCDVTRFYLKLLNQAKNRTDREFGLLRPDNVPEQAGVPITNWLILLGPSLAVVLVKLWKHSDSQRSRS
jgi:hypothetical protein